MNKHRITAIAVAIALACSAGAMAKGISRGEYKSDKNDIEAAYNSARVGCDSFSASAKHICMAEARGKEKVAKAELEVRFKPSAKTRYRERIARANAKAQMRTSEANATADEKSADARKDATADKRDAAYAVAREKI